MFENMVERAIILEKSVVITPKSLPQSMPVFQIETLALSKVWTIEELNKDCAE